MNQPSFPRVVRRAAKRATASCVLAALTACLSVPETPTPMCDEQIQCDTVNGEVCEAGVCWGNPPSGAFAGVLSPPSTRQDAVPRELPPFVLERDGWMGEIQFDAPLLFNGRVVASCPAPMTGCETGAIASTITIARGSQFAGGPGFNTSVNVDSKTDFSIPLPATGPADEPFTVTIVPDRTRPLGATPSAAEQVPPLRMTLPLTATTTIKAIELGGPSLPVISGTLKNVLDQGVAGYRVAALGRWNATEPVSEVSTVDFTEASGAYSVTLSAGLVGTVELVARPADSTVAGMASAVAPTVHLANIDALRSSQRPVVTVPANLGSATTITIVVTGAGLNGEILGVSGAQVSVSGAVTSTLTSFSIGDDQVTNDKGEVTLHLLDGPELSKSYRMSITPPASSTLNAVFDQPLTPTVQLGKRLALSGVVLDSHGTPLLNVAVTARPSLRFLWSLDTAPQAFVSAIPLATNTTKDTGAFVLWVDPLVADIWGHYDLLIEPPTTSMSPSYVASDLVIPRDSALDAYSVGDLTLPDAAYVHGSVVDAAGEPVEGAELKLYLVEPNTSLCAEVAHAPASCPIPAQLQGRNTSDGKGAVQVVLPRTAFP